ncbi:MAG: hypothetical protein A2W97_07130 [Bacteroidetes bacterium GWE2_40_63]|nr:MAG: hypothetical protein A2W84_07325 [Bacteroidetes bacterium GWC2_40_13]OFX72416.1 MAG: hypothetical protein A2W96_05150 [Bacteroidetes bacterium GWD2_40_43]OFX95307.1 MAG: hypothetical protein A2W97_07130 [Bacteroidetes bacterium GWE2_40_63]OFY21859.1 MAG: hypothetical protein A2W88_13175 [Bacteroidetes bacterium GWF2_40_13]HBX83533.1 hypothetical protein [Marinilabiliales bacterium]
MVILLTLRGFKTLVALSHPINFQLKYWFLDASIQNSRYFSKNIHRMTFRSGLNSRQQKSHPDESFNSLPDDFLNFMTKSQV